MVSAIRGDNRTTEGGTHSVIPASNQASVVFPLSRFPLVSRVSQCSGIRSCARRQLEPLSSQDHLCTDKALCKLSCFPTNAIVFLSLTKILAVQCEGLE